VPKTLKSPAVPSELESLYIEHGRRLWRAVLGFAGDPEVASDAVAEAFAQALRRGDAIRAPLPWVWKTAFRVAAAELKARRRHSQLPKDSVEKSVPPAQELLSCLAMLSLRQRGALVLHYYGGYAPREIARILGSTPAAVRVHLHRGRRRLRELWEDDDG
jgi:RNA polymerase sigma-70 factor (ECF subfamily)